MHTYFESVGFYHVNNTKATEMLLREAVLHFDDRQVYEKDNGLYFGEFSKYFAEDMGLTVCGEFDETGSFHPEHYYPFFHGKTISMKQFVDFEKRAADESCAGVCEDPRIGTTIIFYLTNTGEYMKRKKSEGIPDRAMPVRFSALARKGTILLPIFKTPQEEAEGIKLREKYLKMVSDARDGNEDAIEALTEDDMNNYNILSKRVQKEDILSIVDTYFQPYGVECDLYSVCGNVLSCKRVKNMYTDEWVWKMQIESCDVYFDLCINERRLEGVPSVGSRFRGLIWLQGRVDFSSLGNLG